MDTLTADDMAFEATSQAPHDAIVLGSIGMIAAATGLGAFYEAQAAGWLSIAAGGLTALVLAAGHFGLATPSSRAGKRRTERQTKDRAQGIQTQPVSRAPPAAPQPSDPAMPSNLAEKSFAEHPVSVPNPNGSSTGAAQLRPSPFAPLAERAEMELAQLEALVRQMAADVGGAQAAVPDPDHQTSTAPSSMPFAVPALRVGFGAPAIAADVGGRVAMAVAAERVDVLLAPIQCLTEQRASHFEVFMRLRDENGDVLSDAEVAEAARLTGLAGAIDALRLPRVARVARKVQSRGGQPADVLAGVFGDSLTDQAFIDSLDQAMAGPTPPPVVLAFSQADIRGFGRVHWWALATLADLGLHFAIADLTDLDLDFDLLAARGFTFAKLDAEVFLNGLPHGSTMIPASDLTRHLAINGLQVIVGSIDDQDQMDRVAACGVGLGQGALFGAPKPVRREILEG